MEAKVKDELKCEDMVEGKVNYYNPFSFLFLDDRGRMRVLRRLLFTFTKSEESV